MTTENKDSVTTTPDAYPDGQTIAGWVVSALENMKGIDIRLLDVRGLCNFADFMVFSSGTSDRHLKSQANSVVEQLKAHGVRPMGVEGDDVPNTEWVLVDAVDVLVHIMLPETRDHYQLEKLWSAQIAQSDAKRGGPPAEVPSAYAAAIDKIRGSSAKK